MSDFDPIADADYCDEHEWAGYGPCPKCPLRVTYCACGKCESSRRGMPDTWPPYSPPKPTVPFRDSPSSYPLTSERASDSPSNNGEPK